MISLMRSTISISKTSPVSIGVILKTIASTAAFTLLAPLVTGKPLVIKLKEGEEDGGSERKE